MSAGGLLPLVEVLRRTETWFRSQGVPTPRLDAELLLAHVLDLPRLQLYLQHDRPLTPDELEALRPLVRRRGKREPLAYITGSVGFHGIELMVRTGVLVPRPDTETLVDAALARLADIEGDDPLYIADVGCGTGAVGLAIAAADPRVRVYATDLSPTALELTRANAQALGLDQRVGVLQGPLLVPIPDGRPVDLVVSNPPYIPSQDIDGLQPEVSRHEPRLALDGGRDGLEVIHALVPAARARARVGLLIELGHDQADAVSRLLGEHGFIDLRRHKDLGGHERVVEGLVPATTAS